MKKTKRITAVFLAAVLTAFSVLTAFAETYYEVNGYTYTLVDNNSISLADWDTSISDTLSLPNSLAGRYFTNIGAWAFQRRTDLKGLDLSNADHLNVIGYEAFIGCSEISTDLIIPESVTSLNERTFAECSLLPSAKINGNLTVIPKECFCYCESLNTVVLPESLINIQPWAFGECTLLEYVEIPMSVNYIADTAFSGDPNLTLGVWFGSYGYEYAQSHNIPYILLDEVKLGDANGDGSVNINDVTQIQRHLAELESLEGIYLHAADANQDGTLDISDATTLQMYLAKYDIPYPIGEVMTQ